MPRSATKRNFGFRSPGLVRILTAADPDEVLTALEILGISPERPETLEQALENVVMIAVAQVVGWVGPLADLVELASLAQDLASDASGVPAARTETREEYTRRMIAGTNRVRAIAIESLDRFEDLREDFIASMLGAKVQNPEVAWPPMPGIDPQL